MEMNLWISEMKMGEFRPFPDVKEWGNHISSQKGDLKKEGWKWNGI